jgi:SAM-dependent methyltransferase
MRKMNKKLRRKILRQRYSLDEYLLNISEDYPSHFFLSNPAGQNVFLYLTRLVKEFCEDYFEKDFGSIKVMDWGCGKGHVTYLLRQLGGNIDCCDVVDGFNDSSYGQEIPIINKNKIEVLPLNHDYLLPFPDGSYDVWLSFGVLEHVPGDYQSLKEISRVLRPNGLFFCFNLPYYLSWTQRLAHLRGDYYHDRLYSKAKISRLIEQNGLAIIELWHRQLFPKNSIKYPKYQLFEALDQFLTERTFLKYFATNIELVAKKK